MVSLPKIPYINPIYVLFWPSYTVIRIPQTYRCLCIHCTLLSAGKCPYIRSYTVREFWSNVRKAKDLLSSDNLWFIICCPRQLHAPVTV